MRVLLGFVALSLMTLAISCGVGANSSAVSPTSELSPTATLPPLLTGAHGFYPADGATNVSTDTFVEFLLSRPVPIVRISLSPDVPLGPAETTPSEFGGSQSYVYRPRSSLAPATTYEVTLEYGQVDEGTGGENTRVATWQFTTAP